jgi:hypothetical protein
MPTPKVKSLTVRPSKVSHLCFDTDGILATLDPNLGKLGATVPAFPFEGFYATLGGLPTVPGHPSRLLYDFLEIQAFAAPFTLASLRAEPHKAQLNKAINLRQNAFYAKYANAGDPSDPNSIIGRMNQYFSPSAVGSKPSRLDMLAYASQTLWTILQNAYTTDGRTDVVRETESTLDSITASQGKATQTGRSNEESFNWASLTGTVQGPPPEGAPLNLTVNEPFSFDAQEGTSKEVTTSEDSARQHEIIRNKDYGYRVPFWEDLAKYERAQISLIDQSFAEFMANQSLPYLPYVFANERNSMDADVYRLQIALLNTFLMSPIEGIVTGVYKNPGDGVRAGEPVLRIENSSTVLLVASLVYRGPIALHASATISTTAFDQTGAAKTTFPGEIVAVRGKQADDQWEVIFSCTNPLDASGNPLFPPGYRFDYDNTTVTIV